MLVAIITCIFRVTKSVLSVVLVSCKKLPVCFRFPKMFIDMLKVHVVTEVSRRFSVVQRMTLIPTFVILLKWTGIRSLKFVFVLSWTWQFVCFKCLYSPCIRLYCVIHTNTDTHRSLLLILHLKIDIKVEYYMACFGGYTFIAKVKLFGYRKVQCNSLRL